MGRIQFRLGTLAANPPRNHPMLRTTRYALAATALFAGTAFAGARDELNTFTTGLKGLEGQFVQQVYDGGGKLKETSSGRIALSVPRQFRWESVKPYQQLIVADGSKVWVHDPDLEQVTVREQGAEEQNSPLSALTDPSRLDRQFKVEEAGSNGGLQWLTLTPRDEGGANFVSAKLGFGPKGLAKMEIVDVVGQSTRISFTDWKRNPSFAADTFRFVPGPHVDVVGNP